MTTNEYEIPFWGNESILALVEQPVNIVKTNEVHRFKERLL